MTFTHLKEGEKFPASAKATIVAKDIAAETVKELCKKPCGEGIFCEKAILCDGVHCVSFHSER